MQTTNYPNLAIEVQMTLKNPTNETEYETT
jgi:hypothetical protein